MVNDIPWQLLEKYFAKETDALENQKIKEWIDNASENEMIFEQLQGYFQSSGSLPFEFIPNTKVALEKVYEKNPLKSRVLQLSKLWWKVAAVLLFGFCCWGLLHEKAKKQESTYTAMLKTDTTLTAIVLSDGSHIWLNTHSYLKYPEKFGNTREVFLEGEAYFEIVHDTKQPFVVSTTNTRTKVLGTKFNIRSYPTENQIIVNVTEGRVDFGSSKRKHTIIAFNQKGAFDKLSGNVTKTENANQNFLAWKTLEFHFEKQPLEIVFQTLAEVYHFNYQFNTSDLKRRTLTADFNHRPLDEIIQTISLSADIQVSSQNEMYTIK